jgi:hypothetical protein
MSISKEFGASARFLGLVSPNIPTDVWVFEDEFWDIQAVASASTTTTCKWNLVNTSGTLSVVNQTDASHEFTGGIVKMASGATASDQVQIAATHECMELTPGYPLYFEARLAIEDVTDCDLFVGLCDRASAAAAASQTNSVGFFFKYDATLSALTAKTTTKVTAHPTATLDMVGASTWYRVAFLYDGNDTVTFYSATGANALSMFATHKISTTADYVPNDIMLAPVIAIENVTAGTDGATYAYVDYIRVMGKRCFSD